MTKIELCFSEHEMRGFLYRAGFTFQQVHTYRESDEAENGTLDCIVWIAYLSDMPSGLEGKPFDFINSEYGIKTVFTKELKRKLLNI